MRVAETEGDKSLVAGQFPSVLPMSILDGVVAALPDGIEMCQVCECQSSQSGKGGNHG